MLVVKIKSEKELVDQLEKFCRKYKNSFSPSGPLSEENFREVEINRIVEIANQTIAVEKIWHKNNEGYHYSYPIFEKNNKIYYQTINPEDIIEELDMEVEKSIEVN